MVLIANAMAGVADRFDREFAVAGGNGNQFAAGEFFRRATLVGVDMSSLGADHSMVRAGQSFQAEAIGRGTVEDHKDFNIRPELALEFADRRLRPGVVPVADGVTLIGFGNRLQHFGMNSGIVVAGKAACRFHVPNNVADGRTIGRRPRTLEDLSLLLSRVIGTSADLNRPASFRAKHSPRKKILSSRAPLRAALAR